MNDNSLWRVGGIYMGVASGWNLWVWLSGGEYG